MNHTASAANPDLPLKAECISDSENFAGPIPWAPYPSKPLSARLVSWPF